MTPKAYNAHFPFSVFYPDFSRFIFLSSRRSQGESEWARVCVLPSGFSFVEWRFIFRLGDSHGICSLRRYTHTVFVYPICLPFFFTTTTSLSFSRSFFYISLSGTQSDCYFISLFSPEPKTKGAPTALCFCTQPLVLIGLSQENYILSSQWKRQLFYIEQRKRRRDCRWNKKKLRCHVLFSQARSSATSQQYPQCALGKSSSSGSTITEPTPCVVLIVYWNGCSLPEQGMKRIISPRREGDLWT